MKTEVFMSMTPGLGGASKLHSLPKSPEDAVTILLLDTPQNTPVGTPGSDIFSDEAADIAENNAKSLSGDVKPEGIPVIENEHKRKNSGQHDKTDSEENNSGQPNLEVQRTAPVNIEAPKGAQQRRRRRKKRLPSSSFSDEFSVCMIKKKKKVKKNKKDKVKKKTYIVLDNFLETKKASQDYYCDKYFQSILNNKQKEACSDIEFPHLASTKHMFTQSDKRKEEESCSNVHVESNMELPYLASNECMFTQSDKSETGVSCSNAYVGSSNMELPYLTSDEHMFIQSDKREVNIESTLSDLLECGLIESEEINENIDVKELDPYTTDVICGKMVIENIPLDATKDILAILCGYGEIKNFSLVPTGKFFTAYVEIDLSCDIDWIIECLNGSEPFGGTPAFRRL